MKNPLKGNFGEVIEHTKNMIRTLASLRFQSYACLILLTLFCGSCRRESEAVSAFYYWKSSFELDKAREKLLTEVANDRLYIRFFDIKWNLPSNKPYPEAIIKFSSSTAKKSITPVVFITNQTFEKLTTIGADSLAMKVNTLIKQLAVGQNIAYEAIQIDCDWTVGTKDKYFSFLKALKILSQKPLEATIRLHQVKYQFKTGVPPVDRGILMFYNMGKLSANPKDPNSIYDAKAAANYINSLSKYLLPLDIALPVFSWSLQIRSGKIIQVYGKIGRTELNNKQNFKLTDQKDVYKAINNFFTGGVYVKTGDLFKLEETNKQLLEQAAKQLSGPLNKEKRTIIYYELGNLNLSAFKAADIKAVSAYF